MRILMLIGDLIIIGLFGVGVFYLYKRLFGPKKSQKEAAQYEKGFHDAVLYFGIEDLYRADAKLEKKVKESFEKAGISLEEHLSYRREKVFE